MGHTATLLHAVNCNVALMIMFPSMKGQHTRRLVIGTCAQRDQSQGKSYLDFDWLIFFIWSQRQASFMDSTHKGDMHNSREQVSGTSLFNSKQSVDFAICDYIF